MITGNRHSKYALAALAVGLPLVLLAASQSADTPRSTRSESGPPKLSSFRIIQERNIFNPRRSARSGNNDRRSTTRSTPSDNLLLAGVMEYAKGTFAFFDGSASDYRKVVKPGDSFAEFKVTEIRPDSVQLVSGTNEFTLPVGTQMRKEEGGFWKVSGRVEFASAPAAPASMGPKPTPATNQPASTQEFPSPMGFDMPMPPGGAFGEGGPQPAQSEVSAQPQAGGASPAPASGGTEDDVLRRLMQRREQEMNQ